MVYRGTRESVNLYRGNRAVVAVYRGINLVWEAIKSCFGKGWWVNEQAYANDDAWKNNE